MKLRTDTYMDLEDITTKLSANVLFSKPSELEFEKVKAGILILQLDGRILNPDNFIVAKVDNKVVGFGQLKTFSHYQEISTVGILPPYDQQGIGSRLIKLLLEKSNKPVFVVTVIPAFFKRIGFTAASSYPESINEKLTYCSTQLPVAEEYVVMEYNR
ncbi:MAG: GNAT family N-acetyltransferase [Bacteroidetes bacterium]|nr:GNAT family N-acetyltransferase [Bacteroidota bacterium]